MVVKKSYVVKWLSEIGVKNAFFDVWSKKGIILTKIYKFSLKTLVVTKTLHFRYKKFIYNPEKEQKKLRPYGRSKNI